RSDRMLPAQWWPATPRVSSRMGHSPCSAPALRATTKRSPRHCHIAQQCGRNAGADLHARFIRETDCIFWLTHRCSSGSQLEASHWSFFVFSLEEPLTPHLEQFDVLTASLPENTLTAVQNSLQNRLAARFGPGEDRTPESACAAASHGRTISAA